MERKRIWEVFPRLAEAVRKTHEEVGLIGHHDWEHAFRVGDVAYQVGCDEFDENTGGSAGAAGLCHNADRILQKKHGIGRKEVNQRELAELIESWLGDEWIFGRRDPGDRDAIDEVIDAVKGHDGKNSPDDSPILGALMDADRIINCDADLFIRSGQYYHDLPVLDPVRFIASPTATYPKPESVLRDIAYSLDWADEGSPVCVRTRLGRKMIDERVGFLKLYIETIKRQREMEGLIPYPFAPTKTAVPQNA